MKNIPARFLTVFFTLIILCAVTAQAALAAAGELDSSFNYGAGKGTNGMVASLARQPDGKILIGGSFSTYNGAPVPANLIRLNEDGSLDATFNPGGSGPNATVWSIALQSNGLILIGGSFTAYNGDANVPDRILRLNANGTPDSGFSGAVQGANSDVNSIAVQSDDKILLGGYFTAYNSDVQAPDRILRLNADGSLDTNFNYGSGTRGATSSVNVVTLQPDGMILIGGGFNSYSYNGVGVIHRHIARLNSDGSLDATFVGNGTEALADVRAIARQTDGKLVVGGYFTTYNGDMNAPDSLLRLNSDGSLDSSFNPAGSGPFVSGYHAVNSLLIKADGKILVGGYFSGYNGVTTAPDHILRVNSDGSLDTGFNNGATAGTDGEVFALGLQPDGKPLVGGSFLGFNGDAAAPDNILRLQSDIPAPTVTINQAAGQIDPTTAGPIHFTAVFSAPVTGFGNTAADVTLGGSAGASTAVVNEIAPLDGTTYDVAVSGMTTSGTVTASIPAGAALAGGSSGNVASTSTDNSVIFDIQAGVTINQAAGQADPAGTSPVNFTVVFSKAVSGFGNSATDVALSGSANPSSAVVSEIAPFNGTTYNVAVSGFSAYGLVIADVPAGAAQDIYGIGNLASTSTDNYVTYLFPVVTNVTPPSGPTSGGQVVTIHGNNLTSGSYTFGGVPATDCVIGVDRLSATCKTPAHAAGAVSVTVATTAGTATLPGAYTYIPATLKITGSSVPAVKPGDQFMITFSYENTTAVSAAAAKITLPGHVSYVGSSLPCALNAGLATCPLGDLPAGGRSSFTFTVALDKLKKSGVPVTFAPADYSLSATGGSTVNGSVAVDVVTLPVFADVAVGSQFIDYIQSIWAFGVTTGCASNPELIYCPAQNVTRGQMAAFLERSIHGANFDPGTPVLTFTDTANNPFKYYIEALKVDGITTGCAPGMYCPDNNVLRSEMAVFLLRAKFGGSYSPPAATGLVFSDVPVGSFGANFIEQLFHMGITTGCAPGRFCPNDTVTREMMAAFLQRTFGFTLPTP